MRDDPAPQGTGHTSAGMLIVRYGIGGVMVLAGIVMLVVSPSGLGTEGFGMAAGSGLAVLLLNLLYRVGVNGDLEREREEQARRYFDEHGEWPEEEVSTGRRWRLAPGVRTPGDEDAERERERRPGQ